MIRIRAKGKIRMLGRIILPLFSATSTDVPNVKKAFRGQHKSHPDLYLFLKKVDVMNFQFLNG